MAHFLEHLVFKGGEMYDDYRKVNETAERMGGVLNAYTSHDLVAFHITVRAEAAMEAIDLLTDFVGRPKIDAGELDRERGVVIQEIQRYKDQPSAVAEELIDRAAFGDHPLGRTVLGPRGAPAHVHARGHRRLPRAALVGRARRRVHRRQPRARRRQRRGRRAASAASPTCPTPEPSSPRRRFDPRVLVERARHEPVAPADDLPPDFDVDRPARRAPRSRSTRRCWAARWARACSTRSASSAASATRSTRRPRATPTSACCSSAPGLESAKCVEAYTRMREIVAELPPTARPRRRSSARAPTPPAAACWPSRTRTRSRATRPTRRSSSARTSTPTRRSPLLDAVTFDEVAEVARRVDPDALAVACVGPHSRDGLPPEPLTSAVPPPPARAAQSRP